MLINNYNNTLPENVETAATFANMVSPQLFIRDFECRLKPKDNLIINYSVMDYYMKRYFDSNNHNPDNTIKEKEVNQTFTTIITFDEYEYDYNYQTKQTSPTSPLYSKEVKLTTYAGEQSVEVDLFALAGVNKNTNPDIFNGKHYFSIRCIENTGCSSAIQYFNFIIEDPNDELVIDLETLTSFDSELKGAFTIGTIPYSVNNASLKYFPYDRKYWHYIKNDKEWRYTDDFGEYCKCIAVARYKVKVNKDSNGKATDIEIQVSKGTSNNGLESGYRYEIPSTDYYYNKYNLTGTPRINSASGGSLASYIKPEKGYDITGTFHIYSTITENNKTYNMYDYTSLQPTNITTNDTRVVKRVAIMNKVALNRLFEAAKGYAAEMGYSRCRLKLPNNFTVVIDRHKLYPTGEKYVDAGELPNSGGNHTYTLETNVEKIADYNLSNCTSEELSYLRPPVGTDDNASTYGIRYIYPPYFNMWEIDIPNNFTFDLNGNILSCLQTTDLNSGTLIKLQCCDNSHIVNGRIYGSYKSFKHRNQTTFPEWLGSISINESIYSTFENIENAYAIGYDMFVGGSVTDRSGRLNGTIDEGYTKFGYVDYDGSFKILHPPYVGQNSSYRNNPFNSNLDLRTTILDTMTACSLQSHRKDLTGSMYSIATRDGAGGALSYKFINHELFLHLYKSTETSLTRINSKDARREFMKTMKILDNSYFRLPKEIHSCYMSSWGIGSALGKSNPNSLNMVDNGKAYGSQLVVNSTYTYCCGYINCDIHDLRTCFCDASLMSQCFYKDCIFSNIAAERHVKNGGYSNQITPMDIEDRADTCHNLVFNNCELFWGSDTFLIQNGFNINLVKHKGFAISNNKQIGGYHYYCTGDSLRIAQTFTSPYKYDNFDNLLVNTINHAKSNYGSAGASFRRKYALVNNSTFFNIGGEFANSLYTNNCLIYD